MRLREREKVTACEVLRGKVRKKTLTDGSYIFFNDIATVSGNDLLSSL